MYAALAGNGACNNMHRLIAIFLIVLITGCTTSVTGPDDRRSDDRSRHKSTAVSAKTLRQIEQLLAEARRSTNPMATESRIRAAQMAAGQNQMALLSRIIASIDTPFINEFTTREYSVLRARLALIDKEPALALSLLNHERFQRIRLNSILQIQAGKIRAGAWFLKKSYLASARELIAINSLLPVQERRANQEAIFTTLLQLPHEILTRQAERSVTSDVRGWLSLAAIKKRYQDDLEQQLNTLNNWRKAWPDHAAAILLPRSLELLARLIEERAQNIALILPLKGELGVFGRAIRDGFIAAYYYQKSRHQKLDSTLAIFNSSNTDIIEVLAQARAGGAELIIGPLDKDRVTRLAGQNLPVPVIALNRAEQGKVNPNLYQFGLAPEDESIQVAEQIHAEGLLQGLVIAPDTDWGQRNFDAFSNRFLSLGGTIIGSARFKNQRDYSDLVKSLLNVDASEARAQSLRQTLLQAGARSFQFKARRRQDIDFVFLLANPTQAKGINPTLAYFYAEDVPVYATSHVYEPTGSRIDAIDLKGIRFCDIPWKLTSTDPVQIIIQKTWPAVSARLAPFYALGLDAYRLYPRLQLSGVSGHEGIFGSTGVLNLTDNNVVRRTLMWAEFKGAGVQVTPRYEVAPGH